MKRICVGINGWSPYSSQTYVALMIVSVVLCYIEEMRIKITHCQCVCVTTTNSNARWNWYSRIRESDFDWNPNITMHANECAVRTHYRLQSPTRRHKIKHVFSQTIYNDDIDRRWPMGISIWCRQIRSKGTSHWIEPPNIKWNERRE